MKTTSFDIEGPLLVEPDIHADLRGYFAETYNEARYREAGIRAAFVQDNESLSRKGVARGLHWQAGAHAQAKLLRVVSGAVWDVAVDIRRSSPTFGRHVAVLLDAKSKRQLFIPRGFAHGFVVLEDDTLFSYKCDNLFCPESERGLDFTDPALGLKWPDAGCELLFSPKDRAHPRLADIEPWEMA